VLNINVEIIELFDRYIKENPNLLTNEEKKCLIKMFSEYIKQPGNGVKDDLLEFFVYAGVLRNLEDDFFEHIIKQYPVDKFPRVLEVASGKVCSLSRKLRKSGYIVTAIDPNIRIKPNELKGVKILKRKFTNDFNTNSYDLIVGYNACPVAGTLLNIKNKPAVFTICDGPETDKPLDIGNHIKSRAEFVIELEKRNARLQQIGKLTIVDNSRILEKYRMNEGR